MKPGTDDNRCRYVIGGIIGVFGLLELRRAASLRKSVPPHDCRKGQGRLYVLKKPKVGMHTV